MLLVRKARALRSRAADDFADAHRRRRGFVGWLSFLVLAVEAATARSRAKTTAARVQRHHADDAWTPVPLWPAKSPNKVTNMRERRGAVCVTTNISKADAESSGGEEFV